MPFIFRTHAMRVIGFQRLRHALGVCVLFYQPKKEFLRLLLDVCKVAVQCPGGQQVIIQHPVVLLQISCAAAGRKCRWGVLLRAVSKHPAGNSRPALCKCRPAAQIAIPYVILPFKISPAGLQRKMHLPFGYSLPKPKGRCECANFRIAHYFFIFLLNSFSVWICQRLLRVMERKVREQKKSTRKIFGMQNFSPFWKAFSDPRLHQLWTVVRV